MPDQQLLTLPRKSLVALCGPAGSGKSTFAASVVRNNGLAGTAVVSSDACRLALCDELASVQAAQSMELNSRTFELFATVITMRMGLGRPVIADTVNLWPRELLPTAHRGALLELARKHGYRSALIIFDVAPETCLARTAGRAGPAIPEDLVRFQRATLDAALPGLPGEGWDHLVVSDDLGEAVTIEIAPA